MAKIQKVAGQASNTGPWCQHLSPDNGGAIVKVTAQLSVTSEVRVPTLSASRPLGRLFLHTSLLLEQQQEVLGDSKSYRVCRQ